jgi:hypothetical protein
MIRKFTHYLLMSAIWFSVISCADDEISAPPKPSLQANKTSAQVGEEITFTINEVNADAVSLLPYGLPGGDPGILLKFVEGQATVDFSYARPGTFQAIVVANNHTGDGESIENARSEPVTITITSSAKAISAFRFIRLKETDTAFELEDVSTDSDLDEDAKTITVTVPFGTDVENLTAAFTASPHSTVTVSGAEQTTEETVNDFSNPVVYTVTADDGSTVTYTVNVNVTPVETITTIKSITAVAVSKAAKEKQLGVSIDNTTREIVVYDILGTTAAQFDSVTLEYALDGKFAILKHDDQKMAQKKRLDLTTTQEVDVYSQDSTTAGGIQTYAIYAVDAPKLALSFPALNPDPADGVEPDGFDLDISALKGTDVEGIVTVATTTNPAGVTVSGWKANGATFISGTTPVDYSEPVEFELTVNDLNAGVTYTVVYTVTVTVVP